MLRGNLTDEIAGALTGATILITFVTVGELFRGATHASWGQRRVGALRSWLERTPVIPADTRVAQQWGVITGQALGAGRPLPANDAWIASCCLTHNLPLATYNTKDFDNVSGLRLLAAA